MNVFRNIQRNMWNKLVVIVLIAAGIFMSSSKTFGQSLTTYNGTGCTFNTITDVNAGCTANGYLTVQYGGFTNGVTYAAGWTLRVRANGNFTNGSASIPPQYISLGFAAALSGPSGVSGTGFKTLSTSADAALISTSTAIVTPPTYFFEHRFDMKIQGGAHLTLGAGTYTGTVTLSLVDKNGITVATKSDVPLSFVVNYSSSCTGATIGTYTSNQYSFSTYAQQMSGATVTDAFSIQYNPNQATCSGWTLKVRATGNFTNGASSVAPQYFSLRFNRVSSGSPTASSIGVTNTVIPLSTSDVTLINQSNAGFVANTGTEHKFDMIIQGGNHLLLPNGTYTGTLVFTLYNQSNQVVSTSTVQQSFAVNSSVNSFTAVFQNGADNISMNFNTLANYTNGVSVTKTNGLKITGYSPYQVIVKTSSPNLTSSTGGSSTIPVSVVNLQTTKNTSTTGGINVFTRKLSNLDQVIITNPMNDYTQQAVQYNLRYYTLAGDTKLNAAAGTYTTSVVFVVIPQ
ncbi:hypothetical protein GWC95_10810 [Sediminibacterium roseum]|uniref:CUB domain-containing protein n=1 Tax=Sediminibacterium roseum TaxID=1978412 RepID=A0ABW9ZTF4_9BACT|nr:hypothetical protein [Sediminibacterium roseum]NCI50414.1 hypothetical protein [Sediminibacterium roseum]